jgi:regulatory protein
MVRFTEDGDRRSGPVPAPGEVQQPVDRLSEPGEGLAPVIPLFGGAPVERAQQAETAPDWRSTWEDEPEDLEDPDDGDQYDASGAIEREIAERNLLKRLRARQLSLGEARAVVAERDLSPDDVQAILDDFRRRGYLDDAALAEQLIHVGVDRKGQGRQVIGQTLAKRGIPRDIADAALAALPDDEAQRALEFARSKARSMASIEPQTALRRLTAQLARRGYSSSAALSAARQAVGEARTAGADRVLDGRR